MPDPLERVKSFSIDDEILREADQEARRIALSRSRLFAMAVGEFLRRQRQEQMLLRLNEVYANDTEPAEKSLLERIKAKTRRTVKDPW
jgi:metal-responsive CopG/Arc/MetJ family transcriptional regulator